MKPEIGRIKLYPSPQETSDVYFRYLLEKQIEENQKLKKEIARLMKLLKKDKGK